jgi:uncharacterized protein YbaA (DUF1428 family)
VYIAGFVIPVPEEKMEAYRKWAENGAALFREYGCLEIVDSWEDNVPSGKDTDFRRAVDAKRGERIVFSWQVWPDKATLESAEAKMHEDKRFEISGDTHSIPGASCSAASSRFTPWAASEPIDEIAELLPRRWAYALILRWNSASSAIST